jgi:O-antigen/teichoic acid export membrane protein
MLILVGFGVVGTIAGQLSGWGLAGLFGMGLLLARRKALRKLSSTEEIESSLRQDVQTMMSYGLPLYFGSLLGTVLDQYQNIVLAFFTTNAEIGNLNVATNFGALVEVIAIPVATVLFPAFSKLDFQTRKKELQGMFQYSVKYTTLLIFPVAVVVAAFSKDLILVVYGAAYASAPTYLTPYSSIFLLTGLGYYVVGSFLSGIGRTREIVKIVIVQLAFLIPVAPAMAWLWRVPGVIAGSVLSALVATGFGLWLAIRKYGMQVDLKDSVAVLVTALASTIPILPLAWYSPLPSLTNVLICASIYIVVYLTLAPVLKAVRRTDIQILESVFGQIRIVRPVAQLILAYEERVLVALERGNTETA